MNSTVLAIAIVAGGAVVYYLATKKSSEAAPGNLTLTLTAQLPDEPIQAAGSMVTKSPDKPVYSPGDRVYLTAHPPSGTWFNGWYIDGTFYDSGNPTNILMLSNHVVLADFIWGG